MNRVNLRKRRTPGNQPKEIREQNAVENNNRTGTRSAILLGAAIGLSCVFAAIWTSIDISPISFTLDEPVTLINQVEITHSNGERIAEGLTGPESVDIDSHGNLYTGLDDGKIVKIHPSTDGSVGKGVVETLFEFNGMVAGLRLHGSELYVVVMFSGIYVINLDSKSVKNLVELDSAEPPLKSPNDLTITNDGKVLYFTDTSSEWNPSSLTKDTLESKCTGRIFKFTIDSSKLEQFATGLCTANGIQLSHDERLILVSELARHRVRMIDIQTRETLKIITLPGMPDNIRLSKNGGYWVALVIPRSSALEILGKWPTIRKLMYLFLPSGKRFLQFVSYFTPGLAVELRSDGSVAKTITDWRGGLSRSISQVTETQSGELILTSFIESFLVKINNRQ